ncbi:MULTISPECIES: sensor histidine kinase [unclassified Streptomyces]|uniref:sensor histidine kinase n=1 Tax=unclassified Streptomyces TaxID=2593676 RepID=UPI0029A6DF1F|nr:MULTISPECIES: histidine kinase [unclassified Streptomyces]MDX3767544.1 histidine kinase [Streptomyces sp. AK08-01B]MDX3820455.1 histidine kinase [Streptomyces sp. AK08-01A]
MAPVTGIWTTVRNLADRPAWRPFGVDAVAVVCCVLITGPIMMLVSHQGQADLRLAGAVSAVCSLLVLCAHRWPRATTWATATTSVVLLALVPDGPPPPAPAVAALFLLGARTDRRTAVRTSAAVGIAMTAAAFVVRPELSAVESNLALLAWTQLPTAVGDAVRSRRELLVSYQERAEHAEATREEEARRQVVAERMRLARELHDVVTHHLTLVNAQAGVAHHLVRQDAERAYRALGQIRDTSRAALDELRATVGLLRQADDSDQPLTPAPGLGDLPALLDSFRHAGLCVEARCDRPRATLPPLTDLAAYRVVQEAMTNARKHVADARVSVVVAVHRTHLEVSITDDGGTGPGHGSGTGLGLISLTERVRAAGGTLQAGLQVSGGFRVHALLPIGSNDLPSASPQEGG